MKRGYWDNWVRNQIQQVVDFLTVEELLNLINVMDNDSNPLDYHPYLYVSHLFTNVIPDRTWPVADPDTKMLLKELSRIKLGK